MEDLNNSLTSLDWFPSRYNLWRKDGLTISIHTPGRFMTIAYLGHNVSILETDDTTLMIEWIKAIS